MLRYRLGTVNDFHWGFKPVLSYSKPQGHITLTFEVVMETDNCMFYQWNGNLVNINLLSYKSTYL